MSLKEKNEVFDYYQEVARSAFADMLHDTERNQKYSMALKEAIENTQKKGKKANVLDIGTGTGLLAMLAAKHGADSVVTIEAFSPVSHIARKIIEKNGFKHQIKIINKHSTEVSVGAGKDMEQKANILVAEVFDTELIGEGAIKTFNHAHMNLMEKDCICVPDSASVFIQVVSCSTAMMWNTIASYNGVKCPENVAKCSGLPAIHDLQLSQLETGKFKTLGGPFKICDIDFSGKTVIETSEKFTKKFLAAYGDEYDDGGVNTVFFWWELRMNPSGTVLLSCAPHWSHPDTDRLANSGDEIVRHNSIPWRDHWMQGCYYLNSKLKLQKDKPAYVTAFHDEFSWWFDIREDPVDNLAIERPMCSCLFHLTNSRNHILQMNYPWRYRFYLTGEKEKCILFLGDHNLVALEAMFQTISSKFFLLQEDSLCAKSMQNFISYNEALNEVSVNLIKDLEEIGNEIITDCCGEPHYNSAVLPWDNHLKFWKQVRQLRKLQQKEFRISPFGVRIHAIPVKFLNLHKIRWPLKSTCEGFDHELFDKVVEAASLMADENVEPFSLWEYPCIALGQPTKILELLFSDNKIENSETDVNIDDFSEVCNGIAIWSETIYENTAFKVSCGPSTKPEVGDAISWPIQYPQGVHLIPCSKTETGFRSIKISTRFDQNDDKLVMDFSYC